MTGRDPAEMAADFHRAQADVARILAASPADVRCLTRLVLAFAPSTQPPTRTGHAMTLTIEPAALLLAAYAPDGADDV